MDRYPTLILVILPMAYFLGLHDLAERELGRAKKHHDTWARACAFWVEAFIRGDRGDWAGSAHSRNKALPLYEEIGERYGQAVTLAGVARGHSVAGEHDSAIATLMRSLSLTIPLGLREEELYLRTTLAVEHTRLGDMAGAWREIEEGTRRAGGRGRPVGVRTLVAAGHGDGLIEPVAGTGSRCEGCIRPANSSTLGRTSAISSGVTAP